MNILSLFEMTYPPDVSDMHLAAGTRPALRKNGLLTTLEDYPVLTPDDTELAARFLLTPAQYEKLERDGDIDVPRFFTEADIRARINVFRQRGSLSIALRLNSLQIKNMDELGLPPQTADICKLNNGLVLVTGATGTGKTTTIASIVDWINKNKNYHIITIEDPIEYVFRHTKSIVNQRQIGADAPTFASALRSALRQDPDVIVVGEMRDLDSISTALTAAETGHLVISSLHTSGVVSTIDRIIDVFPAGQQQQVRIQLATVLKTIISQQLIPRADGKGRVLATEMLVNIPAVQNLIRTEKTHQLQNVIITNSKLGMHTMDSTVSNFYQAGIISDENALRYAVDKDAMLKTTEEYRFFSRRTTAQSASLDDLYKNNKT